MDLNQISNRVGRRLLAATETPMDPVQILFSTVLYHLKQHGLKADFPDEDKNNVVVLGSLAQVLMGLSSIGWTHGKEEEVRGGLYCSGTAVTVDGPTPLRLVQTSIERVVIWVADPPVEEPPAEDTDPDSEGEGPDAGGPNVHASTESTDLFQTTDRVTASEEELDPGEFVPGFGDERGKPELSVHNVNTVVQPTIPVQASAIQALAMLRKSRV